MRGFAKVSLFALTFWAVLVATWVVARATVPKPVPLKAPEQVRLDDLGELQKYRTPNEKLTPDPHRIVFFGDSITFLWNLEGAFPGADYVNRGIGGQTSADMLVRFRQDVINLHPKSVVILAGINDFIWRNPGSDDDKQTLENLKSNDETMAELALIHEIRPVFASLLPIHNYTPAAREVFPKVPPGAILEANRWLQEFCAQHGYQYIDYYGAMVDENGMLRKELERRWDSP